MRLAALLLVLVALAAGCSVVECDLPRTYSAEANDQTRRVTTAATPDTLVIAVIEGVGPLLSVDIMPGALQPSAEGGIDLTYNVRQTGGGEALVPLAIAQRGDTLFVQPDVPLLREACSPALFQQRLTVTRLAAPPQVRAVRVVSVADPRRFPTVVAPSFRSAARLFA